jgi:hypothetical protein
MSADPKYHRLVVSAIPKDLTPTQVSSEITSALVGLLPHPISDPEFVSNVQFLMLTSSGRSAMVEFSSVDVTSLALSLTAPFTFRRPRDFDGTTSREIQSDLIARVLLATSDRSSSAATSVAFGVTFPSSFPESILRDLLGQFGCLKSLSLEKVGTSFSGRGVVEFENFVDGLMAVVAMAAVTKDVMLVPVQIRAEPVVAEEGTPAAVSATGATVPAGVDPLQFPISAKILSNPLFARQLQFAREIGARASVVVVLLNVFPDATGAVAGVAGLGEDAKLIDEATDVAVRQGSVSEVRVEGKKVFVRFTDLTGARKFQAAMNGRVVDGVRSICAGFYPIERFSMGKFSLFSYPSFVFWTVFIEE